MKKKATYEQPLNEHVRGLLRLEHLFEGITYHLKGAAASDTRTVTHLLIETVDFLGRFNLRTELLKNLERQAQELEKWQNTPNADMELISRLMGKLKTVFENLKNAEESTGEQLAQHYLLNTVKQRLNVPGGSCRFDLPIFYHWLLKNPKQRQYELSEWLSPLEPLRDAVNLDLYLIRNNQQTSQETAIKGLYQANLKVDADYQLIQVSLPAEHPCYPEMNCGKHRLTVRFFEPNNPWSRPLQTEQDVNFELGYCLR